MKPFRFFQIVRRGNDRFYWIFVSVKRRRRRVIARSTRDYRTPEKVMAAIDDLRDAFVVPIDDPITLPETHFHRVRGVLPLVVDEFPVEDSLAEFRVIAHARRPPPEEPAEEPAAEPAAERAAATAATARSTARGRKPATRRAGAARRRRRSGGGGEPSAPR